MHLFTYGTLMFPEVWRIIVCPDHSGTEFESIPATLSNYQIFRIKGAVYPGIVAVDSPLTSAATSGPQPSALRSPLTPVPGLLYLNVDAASVARLDRFEGEDYRRLAVEVTTNDGQALTADTYVIRPEHRHLLTDEIWTAENFTAAGHLEKFIAKYGGFERLE